MRRVNSTGGIRSRVAYFSDAPYIGGAEKYLQLLASHLERSEFEPSFIVNRGPVLEGFKSWAAGTGIAVHEVSLRMPFSIRGIKACIKLLHAVRPSILHCNLPGPYGSQYSLIALIARWAGVPGVVSTEHLPMVPPIPRGGMLKRLGTRSIDRVITVSHDNVKYLTRYHSVPARKIRVVYNGIPEPLPARSAGIREGLGLPADAFVAAIIGSLQERKGHEVAFEAIRRLPVRAHLVVVGSGEMEETYRRNVSALDLARRVHFLGHRDDVESILKEVDVLIHPSTFDATPYVIIEAMAAGVPVVASEIYGIPELVGEGASGFLVPPGSSAALADAVAVLMADSSLGTAMGGAGRARFRERFTIERSVAETVAVYRDVLGWTSRASS